MTGRRGQESTGSGLESNQERERGGKAEDIG